jgi:hypothetical protein
MMGGKDVQMGVLFGYLGARITVCTQDIMKSKLAAGLCIYLAHENTFFPRNPRVMLKPACCS